MSKDSAVKQREEEEDNASEATFDPKTVTSNNIQTYWTFYNLTV